MTDPHDMVGIGCPDTRGTYSPAPHGSPAPMTVRSMDVSARMVAQWVPPNLGHDREWFVLWLVGGATVWFSPNPEPSAADAMPSAWSRP